MGRRIDSYMMRQVAMATLFVLVALTCVVWLTQSLRFVDLIVNRGLPIATFIYLSLLLLPTFVQLLLPISLFCGVLFAYHKMASDSELVVLQAAGLSPLRLARPAIVVAALVTVTGYLLSLYLVPLSYRNFKDMQFQIRHNYSDVLLREGVFSSLADGVTVFVRNRLPNGELTGILVHDSRSPEQEVTLIAERGALVSGEEGPRVVMANGSRQAREAKTGRVSVLFFDRYTIDIGGVKEAFERGWREARELDLPDLLNPKPGQADPKARDKLIAEGHGRLATPLLAVTFTLVGLGILLRGEHARRGQSRRLLLAVIVVGGLEAASVGAGFVAAKFPEAIPGIYLVTLAPIAAGLVLLLRTRHRRGPAADHAAAAAG